MIYELQKSPDSSVQSDEGFMGRKLEYFLASDVSLSEIIGGGENFLFEQNTLFCK